MMYLFHHLKLLLFYFVAYLKHPLYKFVIIYMTFNLIILLIYFYFITNFLNIIIYYFTKY